MNISDRAQKALKSLKDTASKTLERKRLLGQYAVVWRNGQPVAVGGRDAPSIESPEKNQEQ